MRILIGIAAVVVGALLVIKTEWFVQNFGSSAWAEEHLGTSGGTRLMYKMIGIAAIFVGFLLITNLMQGFLMSTVGKIFIR